MDVVNCPTCGHENKNTNIQCESCGAELISINNSRFKLENIDLNSKKTKRTINLVLLIMFIPCFIIGFVFIFSWSLINKPNIDGFNNYLKANGKFLELDNCKYVDNDEMCNAVYEYTVNDVTYKGSPNYYSNRLGFKQDVIVYYNPNNPSEYFIGDTDLNGFKNIGIIIIVLSLIIFIIIKVMLKKLTNFVDEKQDIQSF